jgi:hypothetical protein
MKKIAIPSLIYFTNRDAVRASTRLILISNQAYRQSWSCDARLSINDAIFHSSAGIQMYECGQIVSLAKDFKHDAWQSLSVPRAAIGGIQSSGACQGNQPTVAPDPERRPSLIVAEVCA